MTRGNIDPTIDKGRRPLRLEIEDLKIPEIITKIEIAREALDEVITGAMFDESRDVQSRRADRQHYFVDRIGEHLRELREAIASAPDGA